MSHLTHSASAETLAPAQPSAPLAPATPQYAALASGADPAALAALEAAMAACPQTPTQSVLDHGRAVWARLDELLVWLDRVAAGDATPLDPAVWRLPEWLPRVAPAWRASLPSRAVLEAYATFHDCGKPFCRVVDVQGRQHFPDHATVSARTWAALRGDPTSGELIAHDMDWHTASADAAQALAVTPLGPALYLTALAEIHANAAMFGGIGSTSFKIKWKQLDRRGGQAFRKGTAQTG